MEDLPNVHFPPEPTLPEQGNQKGNKKPNYLLILSLAVGLPIVLCVALFMVCQGIKFTDEVTPEDKAVLFMADDVARYAEGFTPNPKKERITKLTILGSFSLTYEYDGDKAMYVTTSIARESNEASAKQAFSSTSAGMKIGLTLAGKGRSFESCSYKIDIGDQNQCEFIKGTDGPSGMLVIVRKKTFIYTVMIAPYYFPDGESLAEALKPFIDKLDTYEP